jgi:hypothetical protein
MTRWHALLIALGAALLVAGGFAWSHVRDQAEKTRLLLVNDSLLLANQRAQAQARIAFTVDSVNAVRADSMASEQARRAALQASQDADSLASLARHLSAAQSAQDTIPVLLATVHLLALDTARLALQAARFDSARRNDSTAYQMQLRASAALTGLLQVDSATMRAMRDSLAKAGPLPAPVPVFTSKLLAAAETGAIGVATVQACHSPLSLGCVAGVVVTVKRILKP